MRNLHLPSVIVLGASFALASCSANNGASPGDAGTGSPGKHGLGTALPCDVEAVLAARCRDCHTDPPEYGSPMPLLSWEDLHAPSRSDPSTPVFQRVHARIHDTKKPMPPSPNPLLDVHALGVLDAWIAGGAPKGDGSCRPPTSSDGGTSGGVNDAGFTSDCADVMHVAPSSPFTMTNGEEYACYGFDVPNTGKRHVIEIRPRVDNKKIVHHVLLLASSSSSSATPAPCNPAPTLGLGMLYAWAPGGAPLIVPAEAGFPQDQTTHYIVQVHYSNAANVAHPVDASGFDLCTTPTLRKYDADVVAFGTQAIVLFPRATGQTTTCYTVPAAMDGRKFFAAFPHMHKLGKSMSTQLFPGGSGTPVDMGSEATWDFSSQPWLGITAASRTGDVIKTKCAWDNPTSNVVTFGQNTENEMCYSFTAYYPKLDSSFGWATPATASVGCQ